jgi:hypothetical protein
LAATENTGKGFTSSNQIDRKKGLLKNSPYKLSLARRGLLLDPIPPTLSVTASTRVDDTNSTKNVGFHPGDSTTMSWSRDQNCIPIKDYEHAHFEKTQQGRDFR